MACSVCCCFPGVLYAQPTVTTSVDARQIVIGEPFHVTVSAQLDNGGPYFIRWISLPDSLGHFELIGQSKIDSVYNNNQLEKISQHFELTSFDSGSWALPALAIRFSPASQDTSYQRFSDTLHIDVGYLPDSTTVINDIKPIRQLPPFNPIWYWIAGIGAAIFIGLVGWWIYRLWKRDQLPRILQKNRATAYEKAMASLAKLTSYDLEKYESTRQYHLQLSALFKQYLWDTKGKTFANVTTGDLLLQLHGKELQEKGMPDLSTALRMNDAVKFARYQPLAEDSRKCADSIKKAIDFLDKSNRTSPNGI